MSRAKDTAITPPRLVDDQASLSPLEAAVQGVQASCKVMAAAAERGDHEQLMDATVQVIGRAAGVLQVVRGLDGAERRQETALVPVVAETVEADEGPKSFQLSPKVSLELLPVPGEGCYLGRFPVTQEQYMAVTGTNPSKFKGKMRYVEMVGWREASQFCEKLTEKYGGTFTLPKEDVWEKARMAGDKNTPDVDYKEFCAFDSFSVLFGGDREVAPPYDIASEKPNAWGFYAMGQYCWEWCEDQYVVWDNGMEDYFSRNFFQELNPLRRTIRLGNEGRYGISPLRPDANDRRYGGWRTFARIAFRVCWWPNGKPGEEKEKKQSQKVWENQTVADSTARFAKLFGIDFGHDGAF